MALTRLKSPAAAARWLSSWVTGELRTDSRKVQPGDAFIAWPGYATDGRHYAKQALAAGATTVLVEAEGVEAFGFEDARIATLPALKAATGSIADAYYGHPSQALSLVATTGTNGKTSTAWWTAQALSVLGQTCGVVGTLGIGQPPAPDGSLPAEGAIEFTGLTTPDPVVLQAGLGRMVARGLKACAIEASSIGIVEQRLAGTSIDVALFTNFTQDHLDYHGDMAAYWAAKRALFAWPGLRAACINVDDAQGELLAAELASSSMELWTVSVGAEARLRGEAVHYTAQGLGFDLVEGSQRVSVQTSLIGDYNVSNLLVVIAGLRALGHSLIESAAAAQQVTPVPGRMQRVMSAGGPEVVVDYAHTPDALDKALGALRAMARARGGRLHCVFGCGGDRDPSKRPLMGGIAARLADGVIATSDNPRSESPEAILAHITAGVPGGVAQSAWRVMPDRREAIYAAVGEADTRDVVLIAGKGHEDYQEIKGVKHRFLDAEVAQQALAARSKGGAV
ncbi:MAG: UDP-N-acetylmuramoyl-L-alanyl-D-glutamate--2,6-diaminopimelate ligase [Ideonella sp. MAG2]|nr:MAG: UDP-N-acetylmuramoyl-L-alanyl-D-glutamate--2,6-diaminopimelate ligase [Ideonella sp. MAG2]